MTLPQSNAAAKGKKITISSNRAGVTISPYEGDHIRFGNFTNTANGFFLPDFSTVALVSNGNGNWTVTSEVASGLLGASGYKRFPDGMILQWGSGIGTAPVTINFPVPFHVPIGALVSQLGGTIHGAAFSYDLYSTYLEVNPSYALAATNRSFFYLAIGRG